MSANQDVAAFLARLERDPGTVTLDEFLATVAAGYVFTPCGFSVGDARYEAGQNVKSCQIFAFGRRHGLSPAAALHCFGSFYTDDVLKHPDGTDHVPIRQFMTTGWTGVTFDADPLAPRA